MRQVRATKSSRRFSPARLLELLEPRTLLSTTPADLMDASFGLEAVVDLTNAISPDLRPYQPSGWSDRIVIADRTGDHTDASSFYSNETLYIDWAVTNAGQADTSVRYYSKIYVDGVEKNAWHTDPPHRTNRYVYVDDYSLGTLSPGTHTIRIVADTSDTIAESDEGNNAYTRTINVLAPDRPDLTPFKPSSWSDKIVVSTRTGDNADAAHLTTADTLYIDWAMNNAGDVDTGVRYHTKLYVDGVEKTNWYTDPPQRTGTYVYVTDYNLGTLSPGTHSLEIVADEANVLPERDETNNRYSRTITIGAADDAYEDNDSRSIVDGRPERGCQQLQSRHDQRSPHHRFALHG